MIQIYYLVPKSVKGGRPHAKLDLVSLCSLLFSSLDNKCRGTSCPIYEVSTLDNTRKHLND